MFEKVNPSHPEKVADRIAGAIVDLAYKRSSDPKIAVEVLIGHGKCHAIIETSEKDLDVDEINEAIDRITGTDEIEKDIAIYAQDKILSNNQKKEFRCGDNGIFKGTPITFEQSELTRRAKLMYLNIPFDGKYIMNEKYFIICQSHIAEEKLQRIYPTAYINPLGDWTGGLNVDTGATNRKLGSDMGDGVTGGGLHGKDLSKADVSLNIYAFLKAQETGREVKLFCAIGQTEVDGRLYSEIVEIARDYIKKFGGFEKFAEWGLIR